MFSEIIDNLPSGPWPWNDAYLECGVILSPEEDAFLFTPEVVFSLGDMLLFPVFEEDAIFLTSEVVLLSLVDVLLFSKDALLLSPQEILYCLLNCDVVF